MIITKYYSQYYATYKGKTITGTSPYFALGNWFKAFGLSLYLNLNK